MGRRSWAAGGGRRRLRTKTSLRTASSLSASITSPAPGTTFVTGVATSVELTGDDGVYETSWQSDFTTTNGDITVSGGTGSANVTPAWADGSAAVERDTLYVRGKVAGGAAITSQSAPIYTYPEAAIRDVSIVTGLTVDAERGTAGSPDITSHTPLGGGAPDVLVPTTASPDISTSDALFANRARIHGDGTEDLHSTTPASAVTQAQTLGIVAFVVAPTDSGARKILLDGATAGNLVRIGKSSTNTWELYAGVFADTSIATDSTQAALVTAEVVGGGSATFRQRKADGTLNTATSLNVGANGIQGLSIFEGYTGLSASDGSYTFIAITNGALSAQDIADLETWALLSRVRGGLGWSPFP